jgi:hypothetical protein
MGGAEPHMQRAGNHGAYQLRDRWTEGRAAQGCGPEYREA